MLRFNSDSIQHILDPIQTQFMVASGVSDSTQNSQNMLNWVGIDLESEFIHTSLQVVYNKIWIKWTCYVYVLSAFFATILTKTKFKRFF